MGITTEERAYLLKKMKALLEEYNYKYTEDALCEIIITWASQKAPLIEAFKKHPNYIDGKFMIAFNQSYERGIDVDESYTFGRYVTNWIMYHRDDVPQDIIDCREREGCAYAPDHLWTLFRELELFASRTVSENTVAYIKHDMPNLHIHEGEKTSRVINKVCCYLGIDKDPDYNKMFAKYADSLSPITIVRHTILSLNPLDYLTMSFGNSWASCHTIDKENKRNMPNSYEGMYSSGTMSYMLDPSSMVFYTVDKDYDGDEYFSQPKICRQMYHWGEDKLVQGRLYPQDNDGNHDIYSQYRATVQEIISTIFDVPNLWSIRKGVDAASEFIYSDGTHYRDYENFDNCTLSILKGSENKKYIYVGAWPICIYCGEEHSVSGNICCCELEATCCNCGCCLDEDDAININGNYYCEDCCNYCNYCDMDHIENETYVNGYGWICQSCLDDHFTYCEICHTYVHNDDSTYIDETDQYVCNSCRNERFFECDECHEWHSNEYINEINGRHICDNCKEEKNEDE